MKDCAPFILTNVMGPLNPSAQDLEFLQEVCLPALSAEQYLNPHISRRFQMIFERFLNGFGLFKDSSN